MAIGEIGLDASPRALIPVERQKAVFRRQLELAAELALPVVVHNRDAEEELASVLSKMGPLPISGVMHCFSSDAAYAEIWVAVGFFISFSGNVTYRKATKVREAAKAVPLGRLLLETDSPYLAPQPMRGKRCEPAYLRYTAETVAALRGISLEELAGRTYENSCRLFRVPEPG